MRRAGPAVLIVLVVVLIGCAAKRDSTTNDVLHAVNAVQEPTTTTTTTTTPPAPRNGCNPAPKYKKRDASQSFAPTPLPRPGSMPRGTFMRTIQDSGHLRAGVDQNTKGFGYRQGNGDINGFDIDLLREVAFAIFGNRNPGTIVFRSVNSAQRVPAITGGDVDIVASLLSIICSRWQLIDLSSKYYVAHQRVLRRGDSTIRTIADLNGRRICVTKGSTSEDNLKEVAPGAVIDEVPYRTDCLVKLQEGVDEATTSDDTVLDGFHQQDPTTRFVTGRPLELERYGMGMSPEHPEFVSFVNAVIARICADGTWARLAKKDLAPLGIHATQCPPPGKYVKARR
jgi:polar amino acid transport system substrate-binding protein